MESPIANFCNPTQAMSTCEKEPNWEHQKECHFSERSSAGDFCMYCRFSEYCDCLKAQIDSKEKH